MTAEVLELDKNTSPARAERIQQAVSAGEIIVFPAETSYAIGGDAFQARAIKKLRELQRAPDHPLALYIGNMTELRFYAVPLVPRLRRVLERLLPGPSAVILRATQAAPRAAVGRHAETEIHYHSSQTYQIFYETAGRPLVGFGLASVDRDELRRQFSEQSDMILFSEEPLKREQAALIDFTQDPPVALRGELPKGIF